MVAKEGLNFTADTISRPSVLGKYFLKKILVKTGNFMTQSFLRSSAFNSTAGKKVNLEENRNFRNKPGAINRDEVEVAPDIDIDMQSFSSVNSKILKKT